MKMSKLERDGNNPDVVNSLTSGFPLLSYNYEN